MTMSESLLNTYRKHHDCRRREGFAVLEKERGALFKKLIGTGKRVLDLGCRDGVITEYFIEGNDVTGVDIDSHALDKAHRMLGIKTLCFDIQSDNWPIESNLFDAVVAGELLEHIYFPKEVMGKIHKILKPGGLFMGSVPNAFALKNRIKYLFAIKRGTPLEDPMHVNQFSWHELRELLGANFKEVKLFPLGKKYAGLADRFPSFLGYSIAFFAKKSSEN